MRHSMEETMNTGQRPGRILLTGVLGLALCAWSLPAMAGQQSDQSSGQSQQGQAQQDQSQQGQQGQAGATGNQAAGQPSGSAATQDPNQRAANLINTINNGEIELGKMMQDQAQNSGVKDYGKNLVDDHQKAQDELKDVASKTNLTLGTNAHEQAETQRLKDRLSSAQGEQRDRAYLRAEVRDHARAIRQLQRMNNQVTDPQLKSYISSVIPTLQKHEQDARNLLQQMGGAGAGAPAGQAQPQGTGEQQTPPSDHQHPQTDQSAPSGQQTPPSSQNPPMF
jgi:putative membrane protein